MELMFLNTVSWLKVKAEIYTRQ